MCPHSRRRPLVFGALPVGTGAPKLDVSLYREIPDAVRREKRDQVGSSARETEVAASLIGAPPNPSPQEGCGGPEPLQSAPQILADGAGKLGAQIWGRGLRVPSGCEQDPVSGCAGLALGSAGCPAPP